MTCRSCGATIADRAIVCYRCGTSTATPAEIAGPTRSRPVAPGWLVLAMAAAVAWPLLPGPNLGWMRDVAVAVGVVALVLALRRRPVRRPRSGPRVN